MKNVIVRALSGTIYVAVIVAAIFTGPAAVILLATAFACLGILEFSNMAHINDGEGAKPAGILVIDALGTILLTAIPAIYWQDGYCAIAVCSILMVYFLARAIAALYDTRANAYREVAKSVLGVIYIGMPLLLLCLLYEAHIKDTRWLVLMMLVMIWLNDTGAFCVGSLIGKRKLFERLSPKKSWEGFWGGMACCVICGVICSFTLKVSGFNIIVWVVLAILISAMSTWGDLFESMLKRTVKVKDSGKLIPGHGGILDRIDSLLFVAPITYIVYSLVNYVF